jgi:hypothetical protein
MKKTFRFYVIAWAILLALFNVFCFVTPNEAGDLVKFGGAFWAGYVFITIAFAGQLACAYSAFKAENAQKLFYNLPQITISYTGLILTLIFGVICMVIPDLPVWFGVVLCAIILGLRIIALAKAKAAAEIVSDIDDKVKEQTAFIKDLTAQAESLMAQAKTPEIKAECKKVYEALRYSDPASCLEVSCVEGQITLKFNEFSTAVNHAADNIGNLADELAGLIGDRNKKCKLSK